VAIDRKSAKLPKYLEQIGFELVGSPQPPVSSRAGRWTAIDALLRHPVTLVLLSSVLTLGVGSWLTAAFQERQRERQATLSSMDELRAKFDDVYLAFQKYGSAALNLMIQKEQGAPAVQLATAQAAFDEADEGWKTKVSDVMPNIRARMPGKGGGDATVLILSEIVESSIAIDMCLGSGKVESVPSNPAIKRIGCALHIDGHPVLSVDDRLNRLIGCASTFHFLMRPDPKNDFDSDSQTDAKLGRVLLQVHKECIATF
jgi:hypothetical protein